MSADKYPSIFSRQMATIVYLYINEINARALIGQLAVGYCAGKPTEKSRVFWIIMQKHPAWFISFYNPPINFRVILLATLRHVM